MPNSMAEKVEEELAPGTCHEKLQFETLMHENNRKN